MVIKGSVILPLEIEKETYPTKLYIIEGLSFNIIIGHDFLLQNNGMINYKEKNLTLEIDRPTNKSQDETSQYSSLPLQFMATKHNQIPLYSKKKRTFRPLSEVVWQFSYTFPTDDDYVFEPAPELRTQTQVTIAPAMFRGETKLITLMVTCLNQKHITIPAGSFIGTLTKITTITPITGTDDEDQTDGKDKDQEDKNRPAQENDEEELDLKLNPNLTPDQKKQVQDMLQKNKSAFASTFQDLGTTPLVKHLIHTGDAAAIRQRPYRVSPKQREIIDQELDKMIEKGLVRKSTSPWASPVVLVPKPNGQTRMCFDYRAVNKVTVADSHPLPRIDDILDRLKGAKYFSKIDLKSGFWQIPMEESSIPKTAFTTHRGLYECLIMPFGLKNSPSTFERVIEHVFTEELWNSILVYLDDIIIYSRTLEEHLQHIEVALKKLKEAQLKANPEKCDFAETEISFLGHIITTDGIKPNQENSKTVREFPVPKNAKQVRSYLGLCSYYRRFIKNFSTIAAPLYRLTKIGVTFKWDNECNEAFNTLKDRLITEPIMALPDFNKRFHLQTDASNTGVGYTLSQKYDGTEKAVIYGGRVLSESEQRLSTTEKEALAIVIAVRKLHPYLHGRQFTIMTDHKPLNYILNSKDPTGKFTRWALTLQAYNFVIEYRKGINNGNADGISRIPWNQLQAEARRETRENQEEEEPRRRNEKKNVPPVTKNKQDETASEKTPFIQHNQEENAEGDESLTMNNSDNSLQEKKLEEACIIHEEIKNIFAVTEEPFNKEEIQRLQNADQQLQQRIKYLKDSTLPEDAKESREVLRGIEDYLLDDGILYHIYSPKTTTAEGLWKQLVIPKKFRSEIMQQNHDEPQAAHFGFNKTADKIRRRYFWPRMLADIQNWINTCIICQQDKGTLARKAPLFPIATGEPWEQLHCDVVGPFPVTDSGNRYVIVFIERLTAWPEAFSVPSTEAHIVAELLLQEVIFRFGVPRCFITDQGSNFLSNLMTEVCTMLQIKKINTSPYHPQSNGIVERLNGTLVKGISHFVASRQNDWDRYLPSVLFAYRTSINASRKESPYYLMFGREATLPTDLNFNPGKKLSPKIEDHRVRIVEQVRLAQQLAKENLQKAQRKDKHYYDQKASKSNIKVGDEVWLHNKARKKGLSPKLMAKWIGPYRITNKVSEVNFELTDPQNKRKPTVVHCNRLKPFHDPALHMWEDDEDYEEEKSDEEEDFINQTNALGNDQTERQRLREHQNQDMEPVEETEENMQATNQTPEETKEDEDQRRNNEDDNEEESHSDTSIENNVAPTEDEYYMIEEILETKIKKNKRYFLIKWEGFPHSQNTWEPVEHLDSRLVERFMNNHTQINAMHYRPRNPSINWSIFLILLCIPFVFGSRLGPLYDCTTTTPLGVYEFPVIPSCSHNMNKNSKLITKEMEVFKYSPNVTHFDIYLCTLYKLTTVCDWKPSVSWERFTASKKESSDTDEISISPEECIKTMNMKSYNGYRLKKVSGNRYVSQHPNGKTARCQYLRKTKRTIHELTIRTFPAQVVGKSKYIEQHLTQTRCPSNIPEGENYASCQMKDSPKAALVWNDPHHPADDWHSLGKHEIKQLDSNIVIPSLRIGGSIQNEYGESKTTLLLDNGILLKSPTMKEDMFKALEDVVTEYSKRMASDTLGPILQAHIMKTLINQKLRIIQEWEKICFVQQEVSRIQRWMIEVFPSTAARWIHPEAGVIVQIVGEALQVHRCLKLSNYRLVTNRRIGNFCYHDIPVKAPYHDKIRFLRLTDRQIMENSHKINCSNRPTITYLKNQEGSYDVIDKEGNVTKTIPAKQFKGTNFLQLPKIRGYDPRMIIKPPQHLAPYSMLNIFSEIHDAMQEVKELQMQHGEGNVLMGIGRALGSAIQAASSGSSQIIGAIGGGIRDVLGGIGDLDEKVVGSLGDAASKVITSTGGAIKDTGSGIGNVFEGVFGGISGSIKWAIILFLLGSFAYLNRASIMKLFNKKKKSPPKTQQTENTPPHTEVKDPQRPRNSHNHHNHHKRRTNTTKLNPKSTKTNLSPSQVDVFTDVHGKKRRHHTSQVKHKHGHVLALSMNTTDRTTPRYGIKTEVFLSLGGTTKSYLALVDTGATHSLLKQDAWDAVELTPFISQDETCPTLMSITGETIRTLGVATIPMNINDKKSLKNHEFFVVPDMEVDIIIGTDVLAKEGVIIDFQKKCITSKERKSTFTITKRESNHSKLWIALTIISMIVITTLVALYIVELTHLNRKHQEGPNVQNISLTPIEIPTMLKIKKGKIISERTKHIVVIEFKIPKILEPYTSTSAHMVLGMITNVTQMNTTQKYKRLNAKCRIRTLHN